MIKEIEQHYKDSRDERVKRIRSRRMSEEDAEDVVQETFYRACKYADTFNPELQSLKVWVDIIMNNVFKDYRHANFTGDFSFTDELEEEADTLEASPYSKDMIATIEKEINQLPILKRNLLYTNLVLGHTYKACCQIFDMNYAEVQNIIQDFRKDMKEKYQV